MGCNRIFLSSRASMSKPKSQGQHYLILKNHNFLREELKADQLPLFKLMADKIANMLDFHHKYARTNSPSPAHRLTDTLAVLEANGGQDLLTKTFKKLAIVHLFVRRAALTGNLTEQLAETALAAVQAIQEKDLRTLTKTRGGVLREIGQLLRDLGNRSDIPLPIQQQPSRGVVRELVEKVYRPFCLYLQRVIQDRESYSQALQPLAPCCPQLQWKVINLSKHLGGLIMELNRICRYFRRDLLGIYSHFAFLITLDASQFYDLTRLQLSRNCQVLRKKIELLSNLKAEDYHAYQQQKEALLREEGFIEARRQLEELSAIREGLIWVYLNKELRSCVKHLRWPINGIHVEIDRAAGHVTCLLAFIDRQHSSCGRSEKSRKTSIQLKEGLDVAEKWEEVQISTGFSLGSGQGHFD